MMLLLLLLLLLPRLPRLPLLLPWMVSPLLALIDLPALPRARNLGALAFAPMGLGFCCGTGM